jgi:SAM-dependent methyltransferase
VAHFILRDACPVCGEGAHRVLRSLPFAAPEVWEFLESYYAGRIPKQDVEGGLYEIRRCEACGFLWQAWHLDAQGMQRLYEEWISAEESLAKKTRAGVALFDAYAREASAIAHRLGRRPGEIRVLDFGMGWGAWCRMAQAYGYDVAGFELSQRRCDYARAQGIRVIDSLDALGRYGFINCHHALEHVPDPFDTIARLVRALEPGGILRVSVPDGRGIAELLRRPEWRAGKDALHPLEHLNAFTPDTLERLLQRAGLAAVAEPAPDLPPLRRRVLAALRPPRRAAAGTTGYFARVEP